MQGDPGRGGLLVEDRLDPKRIKKKRKTGVSRTSGCESPGGNDSISNNRGVWAWISLSWMTRGTEGKTEKRRDIRDKERGFVSIPKGKRDREERGKKGKDQPQTQADRPRASINRRPKKKIGGGVAKRNGKGGRKPSEKRKLPR